MLLDVSAIVFEVELFDFALGCQTSCYLGSVQQFMRQLLVIDVDEVARACVSYLSRRLPSVWV
jgi:hypothetical protein